jgi:G3E family GTPase
MKRINVYILTGFLGAGKTTTLNRLLQSFRHQKNIVIENEFGKVNIDANLISQQFEAVFELTNGCICCSLDEELYDTLNEIYKKKNAVDNLFVETTGVADVRGVAAIFKNPQVMRGFDLKAVICVADATRIENLLNETEETAMQVIGSDIVFLNKIEQLAGFREENIIKTLTAINPLVKFMKNDDLTISYLENFEKVNKEGLNFNGFAIENAHKINNVLFETADVFNLLDLNFVLTTTLFLYFNQVFRIKGFVTATDGICYEVQSAGREVTCTPLPDKSIEKSQLIFIGRALKTNTVTRILKPAVVRTKSSRKTSIYS